MNIDEELGMAQAKHWLANLLTSMNDGGLWIIPRSSSLLKVIDKQHKVYSIDCSAYEESTLRVMAELGWTRVGQTVRAEIYDFDRDSNGNPTSHYTLWQDGQVIYATKRRDQCGYGSDRADGALWKADKITGLDLELTSYEGRRSSGAISATFTAKSKEISDNGN